MQSINQYSNDQGQTEQQFRLAGEREGGMEGEDAILELCKLALIRPVLRCSHAVYTQTEARRDIHDGRQTGMMNDESFRTHRISM